ncbi:ATP-grasp domain-containing protein [Mesorhizobium sp.]|uniref:ATP-grasp domain-containing protein n=1 Tax=Mesorhizobium sp. TaxID=1871066 RepID=UPI000FE52BA2|nr:ATP-grasp domain-containing protein [Mesorhizobium sp.]RWM21660.1 MAG: ATP-grasp domain-containing protein [Mesorhizobium sp.]RWM41038.1 MAG: ATP-grasp domain-containing protein [Mesorhizobium sp.]TIO73758.1 MAG: ATP-grasp domain-containing protein [Mesorhizobium sp.]TIO82914.1 MAG: ATP-grasp domain-containing protein [Mesorhizobium sp.]TJV48728.1 MAG: ATP-grasp domain-containing protein [Mesorhizobium sp.]
MKTLVIFGNAPVLADIAGSLGFSLIQFVPPSEAGDFRYQNAHLVIITDYINNLEFIDILRSVSANSSISGVLSFTEYGLVPAALTAKEFGLRYAPVSAVEISRNKAAMRRLLKAKLGHSIRFSEVANREEARAFLIEVGGEAIAKPTGGVASQGVRAIRSLSELDALADASFPMLMEEIVEGVELSLDFLGTGDELISLGINEEVNGGTTCLNPYVELQHVYPARISPHQRDTAIQFVRETLEAIGLDYGPSHTEVVLTRQGPVLIETHSRFGGDYITELFERSTGCSLLEKYVRWAAGEAVQIDTEPKRAASIKYFAASPGTVKNIQGTLRFRSHANVVRIELPLEKGSTVKPVRSSFDRQGYVLVCAPSNVEAAEIATRIAGTISIETTPSQPD